MNEENRSLKRKYGELIGAFWENLKSDECMGPGSTLRFTYEHAIVAAEKLKCGTTAVYPMLHRLEKKGLINLKKEKRGTGFTIKFVDPHALKDAEVQTKELPHRTGRKKKTVSVDDLLELCEQRIEKWQKEIEQKKTLIEKERERISTLKKLVSEFGGKHE